MAFSSTQTTIYTACFITVALLVGMHIATAVKGFQYFVDVVEVEALKDPSRKVTYKTYEARLILGMAAAALTFFTNIAALLLLNKPAHIRKLVNLTVFNLVIEVSLGLITAMSIYEMSITRDFVIQQYGKAGLPESYVQAKWDREGFNLFWRMLLADGVLTFVPQIAALIFTYLGVTKQLSSRDTSGLLTNEGSSYDKM